MKLNFTSLANEVENQKLKSFFLKNNTVTSPTLDVPITNEIAERSLGKLDLMNKPRSVFSTSFVKLSTTEKEKFQNKVEQFEKKFLSFTITK